MIQLRLLFFFSPFLSLFFDNKNSFGAQKLANVDSERKRWLEYKTEHEQAGDNLREFPKSFRKEILVPIGSKALIPGHLYHTNEIFVSMYNGLFAKCSADTALSVCEHRINEANKRIDALNVEHKMYR